MGVNWTSEVSKYKQILLLNSRLTFSECFILCEMARSRKLGSSHLTLVGDCELEHWHHPVPLVHQEAEQQKLDP